MVGNNRTAIYVTESFLPPEEEFLGYVKGIFRSHHLTNQGPYVKQLEQKLKEFLQVKNLVSCANGTIGLQLAIRLLGLNGGKVITTPFTYVATLTSLIWEHCEPIFADIDSDTLCLSPQAVQRALEKYPDVVGLMPVHVFGNACDVNAFAALARNRRLKIVYDAAHAFDSKLYGKSLLDYGDASVCSFHATKLFHTVEGGCVVTRHPEDAKRLALLRAFGHTGEDYFIPGINAKLSEFHAAMGLCVLEHTAENVAKREALAKKYDEFLQIGDTERISRPKLAEGLQWNYAYYPIIFDSESVLLCVVKALSDENIFPRRYFYPSLTSLPYAPKQSCPVADDVARRILCLPFWADMSVDLAEKIAEIVTKNAD